MSCINFFMEMGEALVFVSRRLCSQWHWAMNKMKIFFVQDHSIFNNFSSKYVGNDWGKNSEIILSIKYMYMHVENNNIKPLIQDEFQFVINLKNIFQ